MANINYWRNRDSRQRHAVEHTTMMEQKYASEIDDCISASWIYSPNHTFRDMPPRYQSTTFSLTDETTTDAIMRLSEENMAVLNFASYTNPGGKFIEGSSAQEESLCHESFLYNVLRSCSSYYERNRQRRENFMYTNRAIYSEDVRFIRGNNSVFCDVITCASPNISGNRKYSDIRNKISIEENNAILKDRCRFVLQIAREQEVDTLILGAFGCGVFGQNPETVASYFVEMLNNEFKGCFREVVFAVPIFANPENYNAFEKVLNR